MYKAQRTPANYPLNYPAFMSGSFTCKVKINEFVKTDGTSAIYLQIFINKERIKLPMGINVPAKDFDKIKQRVRQSFKFSKDYNLIIEQKMADINQIQIKYRLQHQILTMEALIMELQSPTAVIDFIAFWKEEMIRQKEILKKGTYRQQMTMLNKVTDFKNPLYFHDINEDLIQDLKTHCKNKLKNTPATIATLIKSFKKYLHIANKKGIVSPLEFNEIKNKSFAGNRTFLMPEEIKKLDEYYNSSFIKEAHKNILSRFLFSCFTGMRFSDIMNLSTENIMNDVVFFTAEKTAKIQRIPLSVSALKYINNTTLFDGNYTNEYVNRELKEIAKVLGIRKKVTYHVSRHSFATNFLICGGNIIHLQKILGHSKIEMTMIYVHIVDQITNVEIYNMDSILRIA
ncbi:site-specific integrase [Flavobacterium sp. 5]|uniref:site-specific integrase n=1 Tax=Flavobacterium sp. 5 TaxID=2035199 RepID=UPI000C2C6682|nr:site-specific integrase [Flavobacterium sp. 5]PKB18396.1 site-specific recombinase XerD [Flavobacterium sp. 5]